jgi:hypothetical protein
MEKGPFDFSKAIIPCEWIGMDAGTGQDPFQYLFAPWREQSN